MIDWRAVKQQARDIVHKTMGYPCLYDDGVNAPIECTVRQHLKTGYVGDDVDEFSPGYLSQLNRVIIDLREVSDPKRNATLTFTDGTVLKIETTVPQGNNYMLCEVKL